MRRGSDWDVMCVCGCGARVDDEGSEEGRADEECNEEK